MTASCRIVQRERHAPDKRNNNNNKNVSYYQANSETGFFAALVWVVTQHFAAVALQVFLYIVQHEVSIESTRSVCMAVSLFRSSRNTNPH